MTFTAFHYVDIPHSAALEEHMDEERILVSKARAAAMLDISLSTLERLIQRGEIAVVRIGAKSVKVDVAEIERIANGGANE